MNKLPIDDIAYLKKHVFNSFKISMNATLHQFVIRMQHVLILWAHMNVNVTSGTMETEPIVQVPIFLISNIEWFISPTIFFLLTFFSSISIVFNNLF